MKIVVGLTAVEVDKLDRARPLLQNLGPGTVYFDTDDAATTETGIQLMVGDTYEFSTPGASDSRLSLVSSAADTDVRIIRMGG